MMSDCGCAKAKAELEEFLHRELSAKDLRDIQEHLNECEDCRLEHLIGLALTQKVQSACREKAPEALRAQVLSSLRSMSIGYPKDTDMLSGFVGETTRSSMFPR